MMEIEAVLEEGTDLKAVNLGGGDLSSSLNVVLFYDFGVAAMFVGNLMLVRSVLPRDNLSAPA
jgi:hypothetical protein